jgi:aspartate aminotransferase
VVFKSILDPGDEVIVPCPFFVEFMFYIGNHNGVIKLVDTKDDFHLDIDKIKAAINRKTKAILINSPHNPTGVVYNEAELLELIDLLHERAKKVNGFTSSPMRLIKRLFIMEQNCQTCRICTKIR